MADTEGTQLRVAIVEEAVAKYKVVTTVTDRGDLPDKGVFVTEIIETNDPKRDTLVRVADVGDLTEWSLNRSTALIQRQPFYRTATLTKFYSDIEDAINAKDFIQEEINQLVVDFQNFLTNFEADPAESLTWPEPDIGVLGPLIEDYNEKVEERKAQEDTVAEKQAECDEIQEDLDAAQQAAALADASIEAIDDALAGITQAENAMSAFEAASTALQPHHQDTFDAWDAEEDQGTLAQPLLEGELDPGNGLRGYVTGTWDGEVTNFTNALATLSAKKAEIQATRTTLDADRSTQTALASTLQTQKATCDAELEAEQAVLDELETQEADLLADIVALCPDFTP